MSNFISCIDIEGEKFCNSPIGLSIEGELYNGLQSLAFVNQLEGRVIIELSSDFEDVQRFQGRRVKMFYYSNTFGKFNAKKVIVLKISKTISSVKLDCYGLDSILAFGKAKLFSLNCRANFGDKACGVNSSQFEVKGKITKYLKEEREIEDDFFDPPNCKMFKNGKLIVENETFIVLFAFKGKIKILNEIGIELLEGMEYTIYPGCEKTLKACREIYKNAINFQGEPFVFEKFSNSMI